MAVPRGHFRSPLAFRSRVGVAESFAPPGARQLSVGNPWLAPWVAFFRRFAADTLRGRGCGSHYRQGCGVGGVGGMPGMTVSGVPGEVSDAGMPGMIVSGAPGGPGGYHVP